jgi:hypothetical protein
MTTTVQYSPTDHRHPMYKPAFRGQPDIRQFASPGFTEASKRGRIETDPDLDEVESEAHPATPLTLEGLAALIMPSLAKLNTTTSDLCVVTKTFSKQLTTMDNKVTQLEKTVTLQAKTIAQLESQRDLLLDEIRKQNILIHGIPENADEGHDRNTLYSTISSLFKKMGVRADIDDAYRIGKHSADKTRPVKVRIPFLSQKSDVLMEKKKIETLGRNMYITEDLAPSTRQKRKDYYEQKIKSQSQVFTTAASQSSQFQAPGRNK